MNRRRLLRLLVFYPLMLGIVAGMLYGVFRVADARAGAIIKNTPDYEKARAILAGTIPEDERFYELSGQRVIAAPYLQYIPCPTSNYLTNGHNAQGYRGAPVSLDRTPGVARILFLGGSTTYGWSVPNWADAYPPLVQKLLREQGLPPGIEDVEIINAGLPAGLSSENLTHYHFKFHYYEPDIVVLEAGGNDADPHNRSHYTPDFSHFRPPMTNLRPIPADYRWVMNHNLLALFVLRCTNLDFYQNQNVAMHMYTKPPAIWFTHPDGTSWGESEAIPPHRTAFDHNIETLIREVKQDGGLLLLTPFRANPYTPNHYAPPIQAYFKQFAATMERLAAEHGCAFAPFPADTMIPQENWADPCHLNEAGERQKAEYLTPFVAELLRQLPADRIGRPRH